MRVTAVVPLSPCCFGPPQPPRSLLLAQLGRGASLGPLSPTEVPRVPLLDPSRAGAGAEVEEESPPRPEVRSPPGSQCSSYVPSILCIHSWKQFNQLGAVTHCHEAQGVSRTTIVAVSGLCPSNYRHARLLWVERGGRKVLESFLCSSGF